MVAVRDAGAVPNPLNRLYVDGSEVASVAHTYTAGFAASGVAINLGWMFVVLTYFVIVGSSNAVNLTDGLDGLAAGAGALGYAAFTFIGFWQFDHFGEVGIGFGPCP